MHALPYRRFFSSELHTYIQTTQIPIKAWHPHQTLACKCFGTSSINSRFSKWMTSIKCFSTGLTMPCHLHGASINTQKVVLPMWGYKQFSIGKLAFAGYDLSIWFLNHKYHKTGHFKLFSIVIHTSDDVISASIIIIDIFLWIDHRILVRWYQETS